MEQAGDLQNSTRALVFAGLYMSSSGDIDRGREYLSRALDRAREGGDSWAVGTALYALAHGAMVSSEYPPARHYAEEAIACFTQDDDSLSLANVSNVAGDISRLEGAYEDARKHYQRALVLAGDIGWSSMLPSMRHNLAWALHGLEDEAGAVENFSAAARDFQQMGDMRGVAECLVGLGSVARQPEIASRLFAAGFSILGKNGMSLSYPNQREYDHSSARVRSALSEETWQAEWAEGAKLTLDQALELGCTSLPPVAR